MKLYIDSDIFDFVMYYIYGQSGPSLLIESTDSMIYTAGYVHVYRINLINTATHCFLNASLTLGVQL